MEVEGGSYDNNELPPLLPQREPVELTFRGQLLVQLNSWGGGEVTPRADIACGPLLFHLNLLQRL